MVEAMEIEAHPAPGPARALLIDFGGVLTSSLGEAFGRLDAALGLEPGTALTVLGRDEGARRALSEHEKGLLDDEGFDSAFRAALAEAGASFDGKGDGDRDGGAGDVGPLAMLYEGLELDETMLDAVAEIRGTGIPVALVSNALGSKLYDGVDLNEIADSAVISADIGVRKPSRQIYRVACERLGVSPEVALMVDDLQQNLDGAARIGIRGILHTDATTTIAELSRAFDIELSQAEPSTTSVERAPESGAAPSSHEGQ